MWIRAVIHHVVGYLLKYVLLLDDMDIQRSLLRKKRSQQLQKGLLISFIAKLVVVQELPLVFLIFLVH